MPKTLSDFDPSRGILRLGLRFPVLLYRLHLGWLLGKRLLMLTHTGRKTGSSHQTVVEVVSNNKQTGEYFIASGWGEKSGWYRNIIKTPRVMVTVGSQTFPAEAKRLSAGEAETVLFAYSKNHPQAFRELARLMLGMASDNPQELCHAMAQTIPVINLKPVDQRSSAG